MARAKWAGVRVAALFSVVVGASVLAGTGSALADDVRVGGTGAAFGLLTQLGEAFGAANPGDRVEVVPGLGSSGGIAAVAESALHLSVSSRALKPEERARGLASTPWLDTPYLFVTSHSKPQALTSLQVVAAFRGSLERWPDGREIKPILRPKSDATSSFLASQFEGMPAALDRLRQRPDVPVAATDQDNAEAAERTPASLAGMSLVQFLTERPRLRSVSLDGVEGTLETVAQGRYRLRLQLNVVRREAKGEPGSAAERFAAYLTSPEAGAIMREYGASLIAPAPTVTQAAVQ